MRGLFSLTDRPIVVWRRNQDNVMGGVRPARLTAPAETATVPVASSCDAKRNLAVLESGRDARVPTAADRYRFVLSRPAP